MDERGATPSTAPPGPTAPGAPPVLPSPSPSPDIRLDLPVVVPDPVEVDDPDRRRDLFDPRIQHRSHLIERGPFTVAVCSGCGWESFARRSRPLARREGRDHEVLFRAVGG